MNSMSIGAFAERTRLSAKALRLYDHLRLVVPAHVDPSTGYRFYGEDQVELAELVGLLRRVDMPLAVIAELLTKPPEQAADLVAQFWSEVESATVERRALVAYIEERLKGAEMPNYEVKTRQIPNRRLLAISRHLLAHETDAFFDDAFSRLRAVGPGLEGIEGCPFLVFYGEVSADSDGPMELCRPLAAETEVDQSALVGGMQLRQEPAHEEAFVRLTLKEADSTAMLRAIDALKSWAGSAHRVPGGALRQVLFADQRTAGPDDPVFDLSIPLK